MAKQKFVHFVPRPKPKNVLDVIKNLKINKKKDNKRIVDFNPLVSYILIRKDTYAI